VKAYHFWRFNGLVRARGAKVEEKVRVDRGPKATEECRSSGRHTWRRAGRKDCIARSRR